MPTAYVLVDEARARKIARNIFGLKVMGTARVLVEAKREGFIENVGKELEAMRQNGYWISERIVKFACQKAGEI